MKLEIATRIVRAGQIVGDGDIKLRESYSGRGMFGSHTAGIVVGDFGYFVAAVAQATADAQGDDNQDAANDLIEECLSFRTDSMGRDIIVY